MTDLIARLEGHVATHADCPPSLCAGPYLTKAEAVAILHALKVQEAAGRWQEAREGELPDWVIIGENYSHLSDLRLKRMRETEEAFWAAVKGVQP